MRQPEFLTCHGPRQNAYLGSGSLNPTFPYYFPPKRICGKILIVNDFMNLKSLVPLELYRLILPLASEFH